MPQIILMVKHDLSQLLEIPHLQKGSVKNFFAKNVVQIGKNYIVMLGVNCGCGREIEVIKTMGCSLQVKQNTVITRKLWNRSTTL